MKRFLGSVADSKGVSRRKSLQAPEKLCVKKKPRQRAMLKKTSSNFFLLHYHDHAVATNNGIMK